jgi:hypothetical protein
VVSGTVSEIRRLEYEGPDLEELEKAKFNPESDYIFEGDDDGIASKLDTSTPLGDINYEKKYRRDTRSARRHKTVAVKYPPTSA